MATNPDYPVPALEKGLDILEALAAASVPQSLSELATQLDRSSSELFRMLACLEHRGYVAREAVSGKFGLTLKLYSLAHAHSARDKLLQMARQPLEAFTEKVRQSCHLSVLDHGKLLVVAQQDSPERVRLSIEVGGEFEAVQTASGRLLIAWLPEAEQAKWLAKVPATKRAAMRRQFAAIRADGFSSAESETVQGVRDLAVLIGNPAQGVTAALAVTRFVRRQETLDEKTLLAAMQSTAQHITQTLGLTTP